MKYAICHDRLDPESPELPSTDDEFANRDEQAICKDFPEEKQ
jgi:hypothetical protein